MSHDDGVEIANFELTGWKAVVVIVAVIAFGGWYWWSGTQPKPAPPEVYEPLKMWIAAGYTSKAIANVPVGNGMGATDRERAQMELAMRQTVLPEHVTFERLLMRGDHGDEAVLQAQVRVNGGPAPDGKDIHYYRVEWSTASREWRVVREADQFAWDAAAY